MFSMNKYSLGFCRQKIYPYQIHALVVMLRLRYAIEYKLERIRLHKKSPLLGFESMKKSGDTYTRFYCIKYRGVKFLWGSFFNVCEVVELMVWNVFLQSKNDPTCRRILTGGSFFYVEKWPPGQYSTTSRVIFRL